MTKSFLHTLIYSALVLIFACSPASPKKDKVLPLTAIARIEIPAGTNLKYEWDKDNEVMGIEMKDGKPRTIDYLSYPANYGMLKNTLLAKEDGGDGDPLDVIVLGSAINSGSELEVKIIGVLKLLDRGEQDDKLIAVTTDGQFGELESLSELQSNYKGVTEILEIWFSNYKGLGKMEYLGLGDESEAADLFLEAQH